MNNYWGRQTFATCANVQFILDIRHFFFLILLQLFKSTFTYFVADGTLVEKTLTIRIHSG
uniref:Uncharacterized protein n=1 Tax=Megaselia scalaris TaxID=36166 RepID=T1GRY9_MEGSC